MNTLQQEELIEESLNEFDKHFGDTELRNKTVGYDAPRRIKMFLRKELELIAKKSAATARAEGAAEERSRINKLMIQFEKTNSERKDKIAGWYWLRSKLREALTTKEHHAS